MKRTNRVVWVLFVACLLVPVCPAQGRDSLQYYWVSGDDVYLWASPEERPIRASFDQGSGEWRLSTEEGVAELEQALAEAATEYTEYTDRPDFYKGQKLLQLMLSKLSQNPTAVRWAAPHPPAAEIYFVKPTDNSAKFALLPKGDKMDSYYSFARVRSDSAFAQSDTEVIPISEVLGVEPSPTAAGEVFGLEVSQERGWPEFWNGLIKKASDGTEVKTDAYRNTNGKWQLVWLERLKADTKLHTAPQRASVEQMAKPIPKKEPVSFPTPTPTPQPSRFASLRDVSLWRIGLLSAMPLLAGLFIFLIFRARLPGFVALFPGRAPKKPAGAAAGAGGGAGGEWGRARRAEEPAPPRGARGAPRAAGGAPVITTMPARERRRVRRSRRALLPACCARYMIRRPRGTNGSKRRARQTCRCSALTNACGRSVSTPSNGPTPST